MKIRIILLLIILAFINRALHASSEQWVETQSPHFTVVTNGSEKEARHLLDQFERMRWTFQKLFPKANVDSEQPILIVAAKNQKSFEALLPPDRHGKNQLQLAGFFMRGQERNYVLVRLDASQEHPYAVIYHEYTHLQFRKIESWMPLWLNEGIAQFYQNTVIHDKDAELGQPSVNDILFLRQNTLIPLATLFRVDHNSPYYHEENKGNIFYAESWALVHYLIINDFDKKTNRVKDYLLRVSQGNDPVAAAEMAFGNLKDLEMALIAYIHYGSYREFVLNTAAAPLDEASYHLKQLTAADVSTYQAEILLHEGQLEEARAMLDSVLKEDPKNVDALETRGTLALRENNHTEALRLYGEAYKLGFQDQAFLERYAMLMMRAGGKSAQLAAAEAVLRQEIQLYPRAAAAYDQLAQIIRYDPHQLEEARHLELQAAEIDPVEIHYRLNMEGILLGMDKLDDARAVLLATKKEFPAAADQKLVDARLNQIDNELASRKQAVERAENTQPEIEITTSVGASAAAPKHPTAPATGPRHTIDGMIHGVVCNYPSQMDLTIATPYKSLKLYSMNYIKIEFSVLQVKTTGQFDPCSMMEGLHAKAEYAENPADSSVDGEILSVVLGK